ncbi:interferon alpha/beta receptor 2-like [Silurus meridionalis]|uniref:Uncharacterized protein n=1 Tax=Silurus meridionalis TaxID=175797 RepID=A0A8T0BTV8_SILME|nr:interferon alpha/beta receptor 2-like [Silurus meridionalis]KAF7709863.1 hypothetical protein HF521_016713 [Silurus meridionalis]
MDHVYTLLMLIVSCSVLCGHVPAPVNLKIESRHLIHLLTWQAGPGSPSELQYRVIFRNYKHDWKTVDDCAAVRFPLLCNLTDVLSDLEIDYYINVTAVSGNKTSTPSSHPPFIPLSDTELEPPPLQVLPCNSLLCVHLHSPSERFETVYKKFNYQLNVTSKQGHEFTMKTRGLNTVDLQGVPGEVYCVSVSITGYRSTASKPVCVSAPVQVDKDNSKGIWVFLCLLVLVIAVIVGLRASTRIMFFRIPPPFVLSSFNAPYEVRIFSWPSVESLHHVSLDSKTCEDVPLNEEVDQEREDKEVVYEGHRHCGEIIKKTNSYFPSSPEFHTPDPAIETLEELFKTPDLITLHCEETALQNPSGILTAHVSPPPVHDMDKNDSALLGHKKEDELRQEEEVEDMDDMDHVNFFSLTLRGHNSEQQNESEKEEDIETGNDEKPLCMLGPPEPAMNFQPTYSEPTDKHISYSEDEEDEDEEEAFSGYMMRS